MRKLGSLLLAVVFASTLLTSCVDAQADEVYDNVVPEKTNLGDGTGGHDGSGPL
ncbi:hypothetical protein N7E81_16540 [Reichenbachiella carrageenanivorans]|uniref:Secreted protein n=1 Tax=Reichenbachiella carrageenanivorans TaxID=2979869 RepID=A0ABY6D1K7_9BACT|nr:hypothetical protein [Reichenbachiella carrageenanivorans]UXX78963.1 hypothetical protein N7E81_16540 [Reichenbachiella carrageenanivorans]